MSNFRTDLIVLLVTISSASGEPVLLATFDGHLSRPASAPAEPRVELHLAIESEGLYAALGPGIAWEHGDSGSIEFNRSTSAQFAAFASIATNGLDDVVRDGVLWLTDVGGGGVFAENRESSLFGRPVDLVGFHLDSVRLVARRVEFGPYSFPNGADGLFVDYDVTYEFYGAPIPEPAIGLLLIVGLFILRFSTLRYRGA